MFHCSIVYMLCPLNPLENLYFRQQMMRVILQHLVDFIVLCESLDKASNYSYSIAAEPKNRALFHKSMKLSTQIVLLVTFIF